MAQDIKKSPDRIVGLEVTDKMSKYTQKLKETRNHQLLKGTRVLHLFLVVEAKNHHGPGFSAIERQTAFPIRRLLQVQDELRSQSEVECEPPLVWFMGYQGDTWKVYAGTMETSTVNIYELWQGTLQSRDGALQILQIVDYIWSWARDIYRPQIQKCLRHRYPDVGGATSSSPTRDREAAPSPSNQSPDPLATKAAGFTSARVYGIYRSTYYDELYKDTGDTESEAMNFTGSNNSPSSPPSQDATSHHLLKFVPGYKNSVAWTSLFCVRHSDMVEFRFRICNMTDVLPPVDQDPFINLLRFAVPIRRSLLCKLGASWTGNQAIRLGSDDIVLVSFLFRSRLHPADWEIHRSLYAFVWPLSAANHLHTSGMDRDQSRSYPDIRLQEALTQLIVLQDTPENFQEKQSWILPGTSFLSAGEFAECIDVASEGPAISRGRRLINPEETLCSSVSTLPNIPTSSFAGESLLMMKPDRWSKQTPACCLFLFGDRNIKSSEELGQPIHMALGQDTSFFSSEFEMREPEEDLVMHWLQALYNEVQ